MSRKKDDAASRPDADNPEWTRKQVRTARPALDLIAEKFGADTAQALRRRRPPVQAEPQGQPDAAARSRRAVNLSPGGPGRADADERRAMPAHAETGQMTVAPGGQGPISGADSLPGTPMSAPAVRRQEAADRLAAFRQRTAGRGGPPATELLADARAERLRALAGADTGQGPDA